MLKTPGHELAMALRTAYLAMHRTTEAAVAKFGVTADQFVLLTALAQGTALTQRELANRLTSDANTVRAMLVLLEARGLVERGDHPKDARAKTVTLTKTGKALLVQLRRATQPVRKALAKMTQPAANPSLAQQLQQLVACLQPQPESATV